MARPVARPIDKQVRIGMQGATFGIAAANKVAGGLQSNDGRIVFRRRGERQSG
jgi:hypothetical protein